MCILIILMFVECNAQYTASKQITPVTRLPFFSPFGHDWRFVYNKFQEATIYILIEDVLLRICALELVAKDSMVS